ncbi:SufS family cysteine desulfurase [Anaerobacterium chartisolvens]|uniref:cysteine desulfurase n=1 Tax=Anaerobacterium chartisolvens TaxID=1297424 RepID=A0A369B8S3_9FIRM|nr:cysteine desulfurase [Anaerobacterium chartisolvens]RCX17930.1 SufS family cysteine desulfurase [Anaerobacterium chartisolvens]
MPGFKAAERKHHTTATYGKYAPVEAVRGDFPILKKKINGKPLVWLDNAATTQKPFAVIDALNRYYTGYNSNVHRGAHTLARLSTEAYEAARERVRGFIGASSQEEIIFVRGTTEAINLVASSWGSINIRQGDEILLTAMEHHSNIVPWQMLMRARQAVIKVIPINARGEVMLEEYRKLLTPRTRLVSMTHVSNVLGTINPVDIMTEMAHEHGAHVMIDGAQSVPHMRVDVGRINADFYAFSGHKAYGPTGIGVLYGKRALLDKMPPWQSGGGMIKDVGFDKTTYSGLPYKFEAGTGNIADAVGLGSALEYLEKIGMDNIERHEKELTEAAMHSFSRIPGVRVIGTSPNKTSVISFTIKGVSPENAAKYLNQEGIAVRAGHHCAQPALAAYGLKSCIRASLGVYNSMEDIELLVKSVGKISRGM